MAVTIEQLRQRELKREDEQRDFVCPDCIQDPFLQPHMRHLYTPRVCIGCGVSTKRAITSRRLAALVGPVFPLHFEIDQGHFPGYEFTLAVIVGKALSCSKQRVLESVASWLELPDAEEDKLEVESDHFYSNGQAYQWSDSPFDDEDHERWHVVGDWHYAAKQLTHGRRFFNEKVRELFEGILHEALEAEDIDGDGLCPIINEVQVGFEFFRARVAKNFDEEQTISANPATQLGAPPKECATNGRMSPAGIPFLYLAGDIRTCVAEVRPSIGDTVVVGKFHTSKRLKIFDLMALSGRLSHQPLSFFDPSFEIRSQRRTLLRYLHGEISRPAKTTDTDYLMTQAFTEYIRFDCREKFDGIAFRSVQRVDGINYVLFDVTSDEERAHQDWKPRFDVETFPSNVFVVEVSSVEYSTVRKKTFLRHSTPT